ncbi:hypothetical protein C5E10_17125 [Pseudoclavibacter sp. RFBG4]|uniref:YbdD/YjiX family protein n=1 Tax=Pseudoclavibacter sp. RFBG4 TaxID=2080575 RepID=UPI000CE7F887|nr:YbdD/YjiX family protein [Pseudoclavibacter sp. RFBG4]PPG26337.1 hypothetical protein C5E10_17125 [Pseudoclavibacter sp. RFBG4]
MSESTVTRTSRGAVVFAAVRRFTRGVRWYITTLMGDHAYDDYVACHRDRPGETPMTEREFWREKSDHQDRNPGARCC